MSGKTLHNLTTWTYFGDIYGRVVKSVVLQALTTHQQMTAAVSFSKLFIKNFGKTIDKSNL